MASAKKKRTNNPKTSGRTDALKRIAKSSSEFAFKAKNPPGTAIPVTARDKRAGKWFEKLVALQARLRGPGGCPWDREQTHASLRKFLIEETYEVLDAMESGDARHFSSELGDLILQVVFHSILAEETGAFTISDVIEAVHTKMVRRHPHVFGDALAKNSEEVLKNWEQIKSEERAQKRDEERAERLEANGAKGSASARGKGAPKSGDASPATMSNSVGQLKDAAKPESILSDVPKSSPAALEAYQLTRRAARVGFDWDDLRGIFQKIDEEKAEILESLGSTAQNSSREELKSKVQNDLAPADVAHLEEEVGDLLFAAVNVARFVGTDPEIALKHANRKFLRRFQWMENAAQAEGKKFADLPREQMEALWNLSKQREWSKIGFREMTPDPQRVHPEADPIEIRQCETLAEFEKCVQLERVIWGEQITVPAAIFVVAQHTGGHILGAFDSGELIGFTLALAGDRAGKLFLHSHMTGVLAKYQNQGVGRELKLFQREAALKQNISLIEWTFDPLELRNAHFNLVRLGAIARRFIPNCYGITNSELHAGLPTDRLIAEWWLDSPRVKDILAEQAPTSASERRTISLPANLAKIKSDHAAQAENIQSKVREEFQQLFREGYVATGIEPRGNAMDYILQPAASIAGLPLPEYRPNEFGH